MAHPDLGGLGRNARVVAGSTEGHAEIMAANVDFPEGRQRLTR